jgi:quinol-cytochrome oxidoreductase complex cytochrome b subunit
MFRGLANAGRFNHRRSVGTLRLPLFLRLNWSLPVEENDSPHPDVPPETSGAEVPTEGPSAESWIERTLGLKGLDYRIPDGAMKPSYMLGGLTAFFLVLLFGTGLFLGQFYNPTPTGAHDSVLYIITRAPMGDWVRSIHHWASSGVVITVVLHLVIVFSRRSYRQPRQGTWWAGVGMAGLLFLFLVTGAALRYDQEGFEALAHFVAGGNLTGVVGKFFTEDFTLSAPLLPRIFSLHTSLLPLAIVALMGLHFWLIRQLGIDAPGDRSTAFRKHAVKLTGMGLLLWALVGVLAVIAPEDLGYPAVAGVEITKPHWPVLWVYGLENLLGAWGMILGPTIVFAFLGAVPLLDRSSDETGGRGVRWTGIILGLAVIGLLLYGVFGEVQQHIGM